MGPIRLQSFYILEAEVQPKFKESGLAVFFALGLGSTMEVRGRRSIRLTAQVPPPLATRQLMPALRSLENSLYGRRVLRRLSLKKLGRGSWVQAQHRALKPFAFLSRLWIDPSNRAPHPSTKPSTLFIPASLAFGTGTHPSTQLAAEFLKDALKPGGASVLDVGCGTGILAMTAWHLGAGPITAVENDPEALETARWNMRRNRIKGIVLGKDLRKIRKKFGIVVANINSDSLIQLAQALTHRIKSKGLLILSGLLYRDCEEVLAVYRNFRLLKRRNRRGWAALLLQKVQSPKSKAQSRKKR